MLFKSMLKTELFKAGFLTPAARGQKIASRACFHHYKKSGGIEYARRVLACV